MADRYLSDGKSFAKIAATHSYKPGDVVFFSTSNDTVEGLYVGTLKASPDVLVLVIGKQFVETLEKECAPTGRARAAEGASWRRAYLKEHPDTLTDFIVRQGRVRPNF
jgi:hypothetical protein